MNGNIAVNKFISMIEKLIDNKIAGRDAMIVGTIITIPPMLTIDIGHGIIIGSEHLFLGQMCREHQVTIPHTHIINAMATQAQPGVGNQTAGMVTVPRVPNPATYNQRDKISGAPVPVAVEDTGGADVSSTVVVAGQASVAQNTLQITDNGHVHIIDEQVTNDVHLPTSDGFPCIKLSIYPKLMPGDKVLMFAFNNRQMYYVAERLEVL